MKLKYIFQKLIRGYSDDELWDLDDTLARYILPRLKRFREVNTNSYPGECGSLKRWYRKLDKMIWAFDYVIRNKEYDDIKEIQKDNKRCQEGLELFGKYFWNLWD